VEYIVICFVALVVSALTLFSGFGLGTVLMPVFALFFPLPVAIAATAVVHLANNLFKVLLVGRYADREVVIRFALPGVVAALLGAWLLSLFAGLTPVAAYFLGGQPHEVTAVKLVIGLIIIAFALFDLLPQLGGLAFERRYLPLGGLLSGFFGGLSGNQGALRSAFLIKAGLDKQAFIGTGVVTAVVVDVARLAVYGAGFYTSQFTDIPTSIGGLVAAATAAAFAGAFVATRLVAKVTMRLLQISVGVMLIIVGVGLAAGLL
jgi:uncharacterized membrane protein YfcA